MSKDMKEMLYCRKKKITLTYDGEIQTFILVAPAARDKEAAVMEAQHEQARMAKYLAAETENLKALYLLQDRELLIGVLLDSEEEQIQEKAKLLLADDEPDLDKLASKVELMKKARRSELDLIDTEKLVEKLIQYDINAQLRTVWINTAFNTMLAGTVCNGDGQRLFNSLIEMMAALPSEVFEKLSEAYLEFLNERGNPQVFLKPHTFNA
jgi:hypothetical protein